MMPVASMPMMRGRRSRRHRAAMERPARKISAREVNMRMPPLDAKGRCLLRPGITEVISLFSGLGFPRENFIPCAYYSARTGACKSLFDRHPLPVQRGWDYNEARRSEEGKYMRYTIRPMAEAEDPLLEALLTLLHDSGYERASLSMQKANAAVRLCRRAGFDVWRENGEEHIMVLRLRA